MTFIKSKFEKSISRLRKLQRKQQSLMEQKRKIRARGLEVQQQIDELIADIEKQSKVVSRETGTKLKVSGIASGEVFGEM